MAKVLIADDDAGMRALVRATLENGRFEILEACDGREALELALREQPDLALLDWTMPGASGIEVCREVRSHPATANTRVILLTGHVSPDERALGIAVGAELYLTKPFSPLELLNKLVDVLGPEALA